METVKYGGLKFNNNTTNPTTKTTAKPTARLPKYQVKCSIFQFLVFLIQILVLLICVVLIVSSYLLVTPELKLKSTSIYEDPRKIINIQNFPIISIHSNINVVVTNWNLIPLPVSFDVTASIGSDNPEDRVIVAKIRNLVLMPLKETYTQIPITANLNLLQNNMKSLIQLLDACGMLGQDRTMIKINTYATASIGYYPLVIPMKKLDYLGQYLPCPMTENSLGEIALLAANQLLPYPEQYNGTDNDNMAQTNPTYDFW